MSDKLTPLQYRTLHWIAFSGKTDLLPCHWRDRHHQTLIRRGFVRLRADPFKTKAIMLRGWITADGRKAVQSTSTAVQAQAKADEDRDYEKYMRECEGDCR